MITWAFILWLTIPSWGCDPCRVVISASTEPGCQKVQKILLKELDGYTVRYRLEPCAVVRSAEQ